MKILSIPIFFFPVLFPFFIFAANPLEVVINEVAWMGTIVSYNDEWIELYNDTHSSIDLEGWILKGLLKGPEIKLSGQIPSQGFYLLERTDDETVPGILAEKIYTGSLNNSGENLELYDNFGNLIDVINCSSGWFWGDNDTKQTMERKNPELEGSDHNNWQTSQNPGGTPKTQNSIIVQIEPQPQAELDESVVEVKPQQPIIYPTGVVINEILPSPEGPDEEEEWIEIFNQNDFEVDLTGWQIQDVAGKTKTYTFPKEAKIAPQGFLVLPRPESKITLNNDGDGLNLVNPEGKTIDSISYTEKAPKNKSFNRIENDWAWSSILTPGLSNQIPVPEIKKESSKELIKETNSPLSPSSNLKEISIATVSKNFPKEGISFFSFLTAFSIAIFSAVIIFVLKRMIEKSKKIY